MQLQERHGALWKALASLCFALVNVCIKSLGAHLPFVQVAFLEHVFALCFLCPFVWGQGGHIFKTKHIGLHVVRALCAVLGILCWYQALMLLPMASAVALGFLGPVTTILGAVLFLKEKMTKARGAALVLGFVGGSVVAGSWKTTAAFLFVPASVLPVLSAVFFSLSTLLNKRIASEDHPLLILFSMMMPLAVILGLLSLGCWSSPASTDWWLLCALGGLTALAHFSVTRSFACTDLLFLLPIGSLRFVFTALFGFIFFAEVPALSVYLGFIIILAALCSLGFFGVWKKKKEEKPIF